MNKPTTFALLTALALLVVAAGCGSAAPADESPAGFPPAGQPAFAFVISDP